MTVGEADLSVGRGRGVTVVSGVVAGVNMSWRKNRARARGVESDVILPRTALWDLARRPPLTHGALAHITDFGPWRRKTYGEEILALLSGATPSPGRT